MMAPFEQDSAVCRLAEGLGLVLSRRDVIEITDEAAIKAAGLMRQCPDFAAIRKVLREGGSVTGAQLRGVEYVLKPEVR